MGRKKILLVKSNSKRGGGNDGGANSRQGKDDTFRLDTISKSDLQNTRFTKYYKEQNILPADEWDSFLKALKDPLPTVFRVCGSRAVAPSLNELIQNTYVPTLSDATFEGEPVPPPVKIPWYPGGLAWQFNVPKKVLRKSPEFKKFHSWLVFETEVGNISRQEAVSMLPPLLLDVEPHHYVVDMCAAPGSKTAQLLEALHASPLSSGQAQAMPSGLLIANDSDHKRTHLLIHQSARLPSPALMVTNLDASIYPIIKVPTKREGPQLEQLMFDRILCDVPCSGDGTLRKNIGIWKGWAVGDGNGLHGLQLRILERAMRMLRPNGRIVYSTCSMNPVENEAVIAAALTSNPAFELVDVSDRLTDLQRRPGLKTWRVSADKDITSNFAAYGDFLESRKISPGSGSSTSETKITEGHFPPSENQAEEMHLTRCLRIYPHLQDTGAFFVAVLQRKNQGPDREDRLENKRGVDNSDDNSSRTKKARLNENEEREGAQEDVMSGDKPVGPGITQETPETPSTAPSTQRRISKSKAAETAGAFKENPYTYLAPDDAILQSCIENLQLTSDFPSSNVLVRNPTGDAVRSLYLTNDIVKMIVLHNDYNRIRLTSCGTKVFGKQEAGKGAEAQFRILGEGLPVILQYTLPSAIIIANLQTLRTMIESYYPLCSSFSEPFKSIIEAKASGSHLVRFPPSDWEGTVLTHELVVPLWKSNVSVTLMIDKKAKSAMSLRLFGEDLTTAGRETAEQRKYAAAPLMTTPEENMVEEQDGASNHEEA